MAEKKNPAAQAAKAAAAAAVTKAVKKEVKSAVKTAAKSAAKTGAKTAVKKAAASKTDTAKKKTSANAADKKTASKTADKKPAAKAASSAKTTAQNIRLSAEEKKLIQNYRKCNDVMKTMISAAVEKVAQTASAQSQAGQGGSQASGGKLDLSGLFSLLGK